MTALLAEVERGAERLIEAVCVPHRAPTALVGPAGTGKSSALRQAGHLVEENVVFLAATQDSLAPLALMSGLAAGLEAAGGVGGVEDPDGNPWEERLRRCKSVLEDLGDDAPIVLLSDIDRLERVIEGGGTPGRHAAELMSLLQRVPRLGVTKTSNGRPVGRTVTLERADLGDWLCDGDAWGSLASDAAAVACRGVEWRRLPALTLRILVALEYLGAVPDSQPATPVEVARTLAEAMAGRPAMRTTWAAWQLVARLRGSLDEPALEMLLSGLPGRFCDQELLIRCLLFDHIGWHMHPTLREVVRRPPAMVEGFLLPEDLVRETGRRMFEHFRRKALMLDAEGDLQGLAMARMAALDACSMAQDDGLVERVEQEVPDPYDHLGDRSTDQPLYARPAYEHARLVDANDAVALRGLADAEDREGNDPAKVEGLLREALAQEPQDADCHVRLVEVLLAIGRPEAAKDAFDEAAGLLEDELDEKEYARRLCAPVTRMAVVAGELALASRAAAMASMTLDEEAQELDQLVEGLVETLEYGEFVAPRRLGTPWWTAAELLSDFDADHQPLVRWLAGRVDTVEGEAVALHYADVVLPAMPDQRPDRAWTELTLEELRRLSLDRLPTTLPGTILECGIYGNGQQPSSTVVRVVGAEPMRLPQPKRSLDRYMRWMA